ncbi:MAG: hypothetical protein OEV45_05010 [Desulfobacteraceae bacterium]|jgi:hypothetical protein|nr:hypothetical protein [Desulfobacteraceae bacterium]
MKNIHITLSDTNYTERAKTDLELDPGQFELLKKMIQKIEGGLYEQRAAYIGINGLLKDPVILTVTEFEQA